MLGVERAKTGSILSFEKLPRFEKGRYIKHKISPIDLIILEKAKTKR